MNEVEKMYENAGVEKYYCSFESSDGNVYNWELNEDGNEKYNMCFIGKPKIKQRLFTAEKQLELIKWLILSKRLCVRKAEYSNNFYMDTIINRSNGVDSKNFEVCLASLVNDLWQDLTEEERTQIKNILKSEVRE